MTGKVDIYQSVNTTYSVRPASKPLPKFFVVPPVFSGGLSLFIRHKIATMKSLKEIIREQLQEDAFIRAHEAQIIQHCIRRSQLALKKRPSSVTSGREETLIMNETGASI